MTEYEKDIKIADLTDEVQRKAAEINDLEQELGDLTSEKEQLEGEAEMLKDRLKDLAKQIYSVGDDLEALT